jgi:hypothetical protein
MRKIEIPDLKIEKSGLGFEDPWETNASSNLLKRKGLRQNPKASSSKQWGIGKLDPCSTPRLGFKSIVSGFPQSGFFWMQHFVPPVMFGIYREKP